MDAVRLTQVNFGDSWPARFKMQPSGPICSAGSSVLSETPFLWKFQLASCCLIPKRRKGVRITLRMSCCLIPKRRKCGCSMIQRSCCCASVWMILWVLGHAKETLLDSLLPYLFVGQVRTAALLHHCCSHLLLFWGWGGGDSNFPLQPVAPPSLPLKPDSLPKYDSVNGRRYEIRVLNCYWLSSQSS